MRNQRIPEIGSIEELAAFWDTQDLTDFEDQLQEVTELIFVRKALDCRDQFSNSSED